MWQVKIVILLGLLMTPKNEHFPNYVSPKIFLSSFESSIFRSAGNVIQQKVLTGYYEVNANKSVTDNTWDNSYMTQRIPWHLLNSSSIHQHVILACCLKIKQDKHSDESQPPASG